ncbi:MAG: hypothetical protein HYV60_17440, partial [Planctomycetia bacterium]|nr:hypothetical protein [Planctomycetia bacterium]
MQFRSYWQWLLCSLLLPTLTLAASPHPTALRQPISLVLSDDGQTLYAANRLTGTISALDVAERTVVGESNVATQLSDLKAIAGTSLLLATDEAEHALLLLEADGSKVDVQQKLPVSPYPVTVV